MVTSRSFHVSISGPLLKQLNKACLEMSMNRKEVVKIALFYYLQRFKEAK